MSDSPSKQVPPFGLRLPAELKERVQEAAAQSGVSMNALISAVLDREFPQATINLHELSAFLGGVAGEASEGDPKGYVDEVNRALASAKDPWTMKVDGFGVVTFYPYGDAPPVDKPRSAD